MWVQFASILGVLFLVTSLHAAERNAASVLAHGWDRIERELCEALRELNVEEIADLTDGIVRVTIDNNQLRFILDDYRLEKHWDSLRSRLRAWRAQNATEVNPEHGLAFVDAAYEESPPERVVVLVHGMEDVGLMWTDLAPALKQEGHALARFEYDSHDSIRDAADLLAAELREARTLGVKEIDLVAHSMGGLVARDMLTRAEFVNDESGSELPRVKRLIMIGTPNHGALLARYHTVVSVGKQAYRACIGEQYSFDDVANSESAAELLPASEFLRDLNQCDLPKTVKVTIIAGRCTPLEPHRLRSERAAAAIERMIDKVGDGCVSIASAKLKGVDDFVIVQGDHLRMISNLGLDGELPSAIPIVVERLNASD